MVHAWWEKWKSLVTFIAATLALIAWGGNWFTAVWTMPSDIRALTEAIDGKEGLTAKIEALKDELHNEYMTQVEINNRLSERINLQERLYDQTFTSIEQRLGDINRVLDEHHRHQP